MRQVKISNYEQAYKYLKGKKERPYANNTRLEIDSLNMGHEIIVAKYHGNIVATFYKDGNNVYSSCGWKTITTKERINWFLPDGFNVYQDKSVWYLAKRNQNGNYHESSPYIWQDGIAVSSRTGEVFNAGKVDNTQKKIIAIKKYVDGFVKSLLAGKIKESAGDCWYCLMKDKDGKSLGELSKDSGHIESHIKEKYYMLSLLNNAYEFNHILSEMTRDGIARLISGEKIGEWQKDIVSRDVTTCLKSYLKHSLNIAQ